MRVHFLFSLFSIFLSSQGFAAPVDVLDPAVLEKLDRPGKYSFATLVGAANEEAAFLKATTSGPKIEPAMRGLKIYRLSKLFKSGNPKYVSLVQTITSDVAELVRELGVKAAYSSGNAETIDTPSHDGNVARHFDPYWLSSSMAGMPLVAVVSRLDKRDFYPGTCGELRFIYRLAYYRGILDKKGKLQEAHSTIPLFFNVVYDYAKDANGSCQSIANDWASINLAADKDQLAARLLGGALAARRIQFKQLELNMQIIRAPSGQKTDFGGQAIYLFRIFKKQGDQFASVPLENTPDVAAVLNSDDLRKDLVRQLTLPANLAKIDDGTFILENTDGKLLTKRAISFSTTGRARLANRPYTAIFKADGSELKSVSLSSLKLIRSTRGLVERLNNATCVGCHQSSGTAGFHMLGKTGTLNSAFNQVMLPFSPHYHAERARRSNYTDRLAVGKQTRSFQPPSFFPPAVWQNPGELAYKQAKVRDLCIPAPKEGVPSDFAHVTQCEAGSTCVVNVTNQKLGIQIGECIANNNVVPGHVCRNGVVTSQDPNPAKGDLYNLRSFNDSISSPGKENVISDGGSCGEPEDGSPLGRISRSCDSSTEAGKLAWVDHISVSKEGVIGNVQQAVCAMHGGDHFDRCAVSSDPAGCLASKRVKRGLLDTCYQGRFCREDYICQRLPEAIVDSAYSQESDRKRVRARISRLGALGIGFCQPNYFVFNMRTDGHLIPEGRVGAESGR